MLKFSAIDSQHKDNVVHGKEVFSYFKKLKRGGTGPVHRSSR